MRKAFSFIISCIIICAIFFFDSGCANIIPPSGGPRDSLPPVLINATPADSTTNFKGNRIVLTFDEYIRLDDVNKNVIMTPTMETTPQPQDRGKTITIRFRDSLPANTTFTLNFGNAIMDINEGNISRNFSYVFSTGPYLDSLELRGKVVIAQTGKTDSAFIAVLYRDLSDSAVSKSRPIYIARLDGQGNFIFKNLPSGRFALYAFGNPLSKRYDRSKPFAFADSTVITGKTNDVTLYAYSEPLPPANTRSSSGSSTKGNADRRLQLTTNLSSGQQDLLGDIVVNFATPLRSFDSSKISLSTDSSYTRVPFSVSLDTSKREARFKNAWREATKYNLVLDKDFAEDTSGRKLLRSDTIHFTTKRIRDYSKLTVRIKNINTVAAKNPVLQFVQNEKVMFSAPITSGIFTQDLFPPGDYQLRILYDANRNGVWDPGNFFGTKRQPEIVTPIERKLTVKANIDNEVDIML